MAQGQIRKRVAVVGHSFIDRLRRSTGDGWYEGEIPQDFGLMGIELKLHGKGGGRIDMFRERKVQRLLEDFRPCILVLQIGGNDADSSAFDLDKFKGEVTQLNRFLKGLGVDVIVYCSLFPRFKLKFLKENVDSLGNLVSREEQYEANRGAINQFLSSLSGEEGIKYWEHRELRAKYIHEGGGVHLSEQGERKFFRSLRGAIMQSLPNV